MVKLNSERNPAPKKPRKPMTSAPNSGVKLNKPISYSQWSGQTQQKGETE